MLSLFTLATITKFGSDGSILFGGIRRIH